MTITWTETYQPETPPPPYERTMVLRAVERGHGEKGRSATEADLAAAGFIPADLLEATREALGDAMKERDEATAKLEIARDHLGIAGRTNTGLTSTLRAAQADVERMRPVVEAARVFNTHHWLTPNGANGTPKREAWEDERHRLGDLLHKALQALRSPPASVVTREKPDDPPRCEHRSTFSGGKAQCIHTAGHPTAHRYRYADMQDEPAPVAASGEDTGRDVACEYLCERFGPFRDDESYASRVTRAKAADEALAVERDRLQEKLTAALARVAELEAELRVTDALLIERQRLLDMFDCKVHGGNCVPNAEREVRDLRAKVAELEAAAGERPEDAWRRGIEAYTGRHEGHPAYEPPVAAKRNNDGKA